MTYFSVGRSFGHHRVKKGGASRCECGYPMGYHDIIDLPGVERTVL